MRDARRVLLERGDAVPDVEREEVRHRAEVGRGGRPDPDPRDRGLTLQELAAAAAVSASMLSSVERGRKAPTIVALARIADGLGVPLSELIVPGGSPVIVRRAGQQDVIDEPAGWRR
ncbi:MAG TPA: helix-turn-helix domain-containing protein, partial [Streptosporangiaceae bacterium]